MTQGKIRRRKDEGTKGTFMIVLPLTESPEVDHHSNTRKLSYGWTQVVRVTFDKRL